MTAAEQLVGLTLDGKWKVVSRSKAQPSSGGHFSVPCFVESSDGKLHFLKALDFSTAFEPGVDVISALQQLTAAFNHERDILEHCRSRNLSHVVVAVTHGYVQIPNLSPQEGTVGLHPVWMTPA